MIIFKECIENFSYGHTILYNNKYNIKKIYDFDFDKIPIFCLFFCDILFLMLTDFMLLELCVGDGYKQCILIYFSKKNLLFLLT